MLIAKSMIKKLEKIKVTLAEARDELRAIKDEIEIQLEDKDEEIGNLESLIDSLSKYV